MEGVLLAFIFGIVLSIITVMGDIFIKNASLQPSFSGWRLFTIGSILWVITAFGWFSLMRKVKLSTLGVLYSLSTIILLTLVSVFYFKEKLAAIEIVGIALALISLVILARFA